MKTMYLIKRILMAVVDFFIMYYSASFIAELIFEVNITTEQIDQLTYYLSTPQTSDILYNDEFKMLVVDVFNSSAITVLVTALLMLIYTVIFTRVLKGTTVAGRIYRIIIVQDKHLPTQNALAIRGMFGYGIIIFIILGVVAASITTVNFITMMGILSLSIMVYMCFAVINLIYLLVKGYSLVDIMSKTRLFIVQFPPKK